MHNQSEHLCACEHYKCVYIYIYIYILLEVVFVHVGHWILGGFAIVPSHEESALYTCHHFFFK